MESNWNVLFCWSAVILPVIRAGRHGAYLPRAIYIQWRRESISAEALFKILLEAVMVPPLSSGIDMHSSDNRTNFAADRLMKLREDILEFLISSGRILDVYCFDQNKYLENHSKIPELGLEQDAKYFWIFCNLDYEKWMQRRSEAKLLGLHGPSTEDLEFAASVTGATGEAEVQVRGYEQIFCTA